MYIYIYIVIIISILILRIIMKKKTTTRTNSCTTYLACIENQTSTVGIEHATITWERIASMIGVARHECPAHCATLLNASMLHLHTLS